MPYRWWGDPVSMMNELRRMQNQGGAKPEHRLPVAGVFPAVNLYDDGESFMIRAEVPGIDKAKLEITTKGNNVSIRGERGVGPSTQEVAYHRRERSAGVFHRVVTLPEHVDTAKIVANYKNGILEVVCPRAESAKPRKVEIG